MIALMIFLLLQE